jgi:cytochrome c-type biogenesis protein CcsB
MTWTFNLSLAGYLAALLLATVNLFKREQRRLAAATTAVLAAGAIIQTAYLILRWVAAGRAPFSNMFESLVLFAWALVVVYLGLQRGRNIPVVATGTALAAVLVLAYASTFESKIEPLMPALRSNWLTVHVFTCFLGYGAVTIAMLSSAAYLIANRRREIGITAQAAPAGKGTEISPLLEAATDKTISFGFLFLTVGIISGAVWANAAWGTYWSWDPKETWSLITWFIYAVYLHCRFMRGWRGRRAAWISVIGFASVVFTYVGVNFLLSGLHSYAAK